MGVLGVPLLAMPVLGGWLVDAVSWRATFLVHLSVGALPIRTTAETIIVPSVQ